MDVPAGDRVNQHPFAALGVLGFERLDRNLRVARELLRKEFDGVRLVVLNADDPLCLREEPQHHPQSFDQLVRPLQHQAVVAGEVRLTLGAVDDDRVD